MLYTRYLLHHVAIMMMFLDLASLYAVESESKSCSVVSDSLQPHGLYSPWNSLGQNIGMGSLSLLQGIFPTQGSSPGLPHCRWILYHLSYQGYIILYGPVQNEIAGPLVQKLRISRCWEQNIRSHAELNLSICEVCPMWVWAVLFSLSHNFMRKIEGTLFYSYRTDT